jgi:hypothetical protein
MIKVNLIYLLASLIPTGLVAKENTSTIELIQPLINVKSKGVGNKQAIEAWPSVSQLPSSAIPELLSAMNQANNLGDNWIRGALNKICEKNPKAIPINKIVDFIKDDSNKGEARHMAFQIILSHQPMKANQLIPTFIDDPIPALRREAVAKILVNAKKPENKEDKIKLYKKALMKGREVDQIAEASQALEENGEKINLTRLMGFLINWHTIGPFQNKDRNGFAKVYPPETRINHKEKYQGTSGSTSWTAFSTEDKLGMLDINKQYGELKEVVAYAETKFISKKEQNVHFRIGSKNAWKLWVNEKLLFARDEYHRGKTRIDQFIIDGKLKKGENQILLKVCQNEQTQSWTKQWEFNFRVTDLTGAAIHPMNSTQNK